MPLADAVGALDCRASSAGPKVRTASSRFRNERTLQAGFRGTSAGGAAARACGPGPSSSQRLIASRSVRSRSSAEAAWGCSEPLDGSYDLPFLQITMVHLPRWAIRRTGFRGKEVGLIVVGRTVCGPHDV